MSLSERLRTLRSYLDGSGDLEGVSFGVRRGDRAFWWRKHLTVVDEAATTIDTQAAEIERLRASLAAHEEVIHSAARSIFNPNSGGDAPSVCSDCGLDWCGATCGRWPKGAVDA